MMRTVLVPTQATQAAAPRPMMRCGDQLGVNVNVNVNGIYDNDRLP
jgi:hypothetical protein